jgi:ATP adenylyltransferase
MERLWAPWRLSYVASAKSPSTVAPCFICEGVASQEDRLKHVVLRSAHSVVLLNKYPYNNGHLLVAPVQHKGRLNELSPAEVLDNSKTLCNMLRLLDGLLQPEGYNVGLNLGIAAGAGLPGHLHWHVVPRWNGDTNFMPVLGNTKVIAQSLDALYELLIRGLKDGTIN